MKENINLPAPVINAHTSIIPQILGNKFDLFESKLDV